jgi:hypothetical protein
MRADRLRYTARAMPRLPPVAAASIAVVAVAARHGQNAALPLQLVAIALASGVGFAFDDRAHESLAASPTSLLRRRLLRAAVVVPLGVILWTTLLLWQGTAGVEEAWALAAMFAGLLGMSVGIAGVASRRSSRGVGGFAVTPSLFVAVVFSTMVPPRWRPLPLGDIPGGWLPIYERWATAAMIGVLVFLVSSRDRAVTRVRG